MTSYFSLNPLFMSKHFWTFCFRQIPFLVELHFSVSSRTEIKVFSYEMYA